MIEDLNKAKRQLEQAKQSFAAAQKKYHKLRERYAGPFNVQIIEARARYVRAKRELLKASAMLQTLSARIQFSTAQPLLPHRYPKPPRTHPDLEKEIEEAAEHAKRADRNYLSSRRKYRELQQQVKGPFTVEMIEAEARYRHWSRERTNAKYKLRGLLVIQKARRK